MNVRTLALNTALPAFVSHLFFGKKEVFLRVSLLSMRRLYQREQTVFSQNLLFRQQRPSNLNFEFLFPVVNGTSFFSVLDEDQIDLHHILNVDLNKIAGNDSEIFIHFHCCWMVFVIFERTCVLSKMT